MTILIVSLMPFSCFFFSATVHSIWMYCAKRHTFDLARW